MHYFCTVLYVLQLLSSQTSTADANSIIGKEIGDLEYMTEVNAEDSSNYEAGNSSSAGAQYEVQQEDSASAEAQLKHEIVCAICEELILVDQMQGSLNDFEDVLQYAKKLFCRSDCELTKHWPKNWRETEKLLNEHGYQNPKELFVCLDGRHYTQWDVVEDPNALCRHCGKKGSIKYYYLGLSDKIRTWFGDFSMCEKMLAHWINKEAWISGKRPNNVLKEVWDGSCSIN